MAKNNVFEDMGEMFEMALPPEANLQLADPTLVNYYKNYKNRYVYIDKEIDDSLLDEVRLIMLWNKEDEEANIPVNERKPIKMLLHTYGGDLSITMLMIAVMNASKTPIWTINLNCAMSAGCLLLINGHKRYAMKNSTALIHSGSQTSSGTSSYEATVAQTDNYKKLIASVRENIIQHTKISKQQLSRKSRNEWFLYEQDQLRLSLVDEVVENLTDIL